MSQGFRYRFRIVLINSFLVGGFIASSFINPSLSLADISVPQPPEIQIFRPLEPRKPTCLDKCVEAFDTCMEWHQWFDMCESDFQFCQAFCSETFRLQHFEPLAEEPEIFEPPSEE